jgi:hypothetical protein
MCIVGTPGTLGTPTHGGNFSLKHKQFKKQVRERIHNKTIEEKLDD